MGKRLLFGLRFQSADRRKRRLAFLSVAMMVAGALWLSTNFAIQAVKSNWNERLLDELVESLILRAEFAIDNVILAEVDLLGAGHSTCTFDAMSAARASIYHHSALVDIQIRTPEGVCQAFEGFGLDQATILTAKDQALVARNSDFQFMRLANEDSLGLGVVWEFSQDHYMTAVIRTDGLLFDMLPAAIRDDTRLVLSLADGSVIARYDGGAGSAEPDGTALMFSASSQRFPLTANLSMPRAAFNAWHDVASPLLWLSTALLSGVLGLLVALGLVRAPSERDLLQAGLQSGEITPYFQPIVSLVTKRVVGCEVLARWIKSDGTQVSPAVFIPLAELTGQSDEITRTLMHQAGRDLGDAIADRGGFKINFNLTAKQLASPNFTAEFLAYADQCGLPKEQLVVELIERESLDSMGSAKAALTELQSHGIRVAIDDVGTGQNGLALLQSLGADIVKIDKLFVDMIDEDESSRAIPEMLVRIAQSSNMSLVAEGIERAEQAVILQAMGITEAQGFYFARPLPAADFLSFLEADADLTEAAKTSSQYAPTQALNYAQSPAGKSRKAA